MEEEIIVLYLFNLSPQIWRSVNFSYFSYFSYFTYLSVLEFVFEFRREKSEKEVKVAMVKLLHWADSSALLERSRVG